MATSTLTLLRGDGQGGFSLQKTILVGDTPQGLTTGDINGDGELDLIVANTNENTLGLLLSLNHAASGTRLIGSTLPSCPESTEIAQDAPGRSVSFEFATDTRCRLDRIVLDLQFDPQEAGSMSLRTPFGLEQALAEESAPRPAPGRWRPEELASLARVESHPLVGAWSLSSSFEVESAQMWVNTYPFDPFDPDTLTGLCDSGQDQAAEPSFVCRLPGDLDGAQLEDDEDEDVFLLEGDFEGAFVRGQIIEVVAISDPGADLDVALRAFRASKPLAVALEDNGVWSLSFEVPPEYSGRYFAVHVSGAGVEDLSYDLQIVVE